MGKNRKKPRAKGVKNRRFGRWSLAELKQEPKTAEWRAAREREVQSRYEKNAASISTVREVWKGARHQGTQDYYVVVFKEIKYYYRLSLLFSGHKYMWQLEDWRCHKKKISIVYGDKDRALHAMECGWEEGTRFGITWKTELDIS